MKNRTQSGKQGVMTRKAMTALCALIAVLVVCTSVIGGTLAYLKDVTGEIVNTFALGDLTYVLNFDANPPENYEDNDVDDLPGSMTSTPAPETKYTFVVKSTPVLTGYNFLGWADAENGEKVHEPDSVTVEYGAGDSYADGVTTKTVYAVWEPIQYTVVYKANADTGITGSTASSVHTYNVEKNLNKNGYERTGYTFIVWNTKPDGSGTSYSDGAPVENLTTVDDDTVTLYAQWGAKSYVIRYHANGGEGTMQDQTIEYDKPTVLSKNLFTKDDYKFMGWALTPDGEVKYLDQQAVVNLSESGTIDLYAVWEQNSHTVKFDYNGGFGSPDSKQVQYGKAYGQLPEYPVHPTKPSGTAEVMTYLFTGWYTEQEGGTRVYPSDIVNRTDDHTLYAHWEEAPSNNVIQNMIVKNNPDDDFDGVVDDILLEFKCSSFFEKYNIPLKRLVPGQTYELTFTASNNASFGDIESGYKNSVYASYILEDKTLTQGRLSDDLPKDIIATWNSRKEPDGNNDGSQAAMNDEELQGPHYNRSIRFVATESVMYWTWDFGLMQDNINNNYSILDIKLKPVKPQIKFGEKELIIGTNSKAKVLNDNSTGTQTAFTFDGDGGTEAMYFPITDLTEGTTYTIEFDHKFEGALINSNSYDYGCGILNTAPTLTKSKMSEISSNWASNVFIMPSVTGNTEKVTLTFTATSDTAYWVWNMANASDSTNCDISVRVTKFSAKHGGDGGSITYHSATSYATQTADTIPASELPIIFTNNLSTAVTVSGVDDAVVGRDWVLTLTGEDLPDILQVNINSWPYVTGVNETLVWSVAEATSGTPKPEWLTENADGSQTLTIPAEKMTSSALITISGEYYDTYSLTELTTDILN